MPDSASVPDSASGVLVASPSKVVLAPGLLQCLALSRLTSDGGSSPVDPTREPVTVVSDDESVAQVARTGDCPWIGVIGVGGGSARLTVKLGEGETSLAAFVSVETRASTTYELRLSPQIVKVGVTTTYDGNGSCMGPCPRLVYLGERLADDVKVVHRLLSLSTDTPGIARLELDDEQGAYLLTGVAAGTTRVSGSYSIPGAQALPLAPAEIKVPGNADLRYVACVKLREEETEPSVTCGSFVEWSYVTTQDPCYVPEAVLNFQDPETQADWSEAWTGGMDWTVTGALSLTTQGSSPHVCPAGTVDGDAAVTACLEGTCKTLSLAVVDPDKTYDLSLSAAGFISGDNDIACGDVSVQLATSGAPDRDVTLSATVSWKFQETNDIAISLVTKEDGTPYTNEHDQLCFHALPMGGTPTSDVLQVAVHLTWGTATHDAVLQLQFWSGM